MAEGVNHVTKGAIRHGSRLIFCLRNPQIWGFVEQKYYTKFTKPFFPSEYKRNKTVWPRETNVFHRERSGQFYNSLQHKVVSLAWKRSHITPVFKGGAPNDPSNYRPIAVVPVVAKILERIVATQLSVYLERNNLLHPHQGAYRCGKSTAEDILLLAVDYIASLLDKGSAAFIDLRKAFDSLDHCLLLQRISDLGVHCQVLEWFKNYLTDRYHRVKAAGIFSSWRLMKGGIPQGSALAPLLFLIYMNSLPSQLTDGLLLQHVDDTTVICSGVDPTAVQTIMCSQLSLIQHWVLQSKMRINFKKSSVMWFRASSRSAGILYPPISIDGVELTVTTKQKYIWGSFLIVVCPGLIMLPVCVVKCHIIYICSALIVMLLITI